jgi:hypothetical protein
MTNRVRQEYAIIEYWLRAGFIKEEGDSYVLTKRGKEQKDKSNGR